jgi:GT2 family glycosyltransferase
MHFFAYHEDVDLSWMAQLLNSKVVSCPTSICHHKGGATSGEQSSDCIPSLQKSTQSSNQELPICGFGVLSFALAFTAILASLFIFFVTYSMTATVFQSMLTAVRILAQLLVP